MKMTTAVHHIFLLVSYYAYFKNQKTSLLGERYGPSSRYDSWVAPANNSL